MTLKTHTNTHRLITSRTWCSMYWMRWMFVFCTNCLVFLSSFVYNSHTTNTFLSQYISSLHFFHSFIYASFVILLLPPFFFLFWFTVLVAQPVARAYRFFFTLDDVSSVWRAPLKSTNEKHQRKKQLKQASKHHTSSSSPRMHIFVYIYFHWGI